MGRHTSKRNPRRGILSSSLKHRNVNSFRHAGCKSYFHNGSRADKPGIRP
jgi:hypothetical protein